MRHASPFTALAALAVVTLGTAFGAGPVPRKAPEFVIQSTNGKQTLLSAYRGKVVVLALMQTTCSHCQKTAPVLAQLQKEYADKGLQVLGAAWDEHAKTQVDAFNRIFGINFPCGYSTPENVLAFLQQPANNPPFVPILILIDKTGTIRAQHMMTADDVNNAESVEGKWFTNQDANLKAEIEKMLKTGPATSKK